jgi:hypothetical protein
MQADTGAFTMTASLNSGETRGTVENDRVLPYDFQIGQVIHEAWSKVSGTKLTYFGAILWYVVISALCIGLFDILLHFFHNANDPIYKFIQHLVLICLYPLWIGMGYIAARRSVNLPITSKQVFYSYHFFWRLIGKLLLVSIIAHLISPSIVRSFMGIYIAAIGLLMIYLMFGLAYADLLIVEKNFRILQALSVSFRGFTRHGFKIIALHIVMGFIFLLSAIPFFIGLIWSIPLLLNVYGILYRTIFGIEDRTKNL